MKVISNRAGRIVMSEENILCGVSSANLQKGFTKGYGLYVIDRRIIGVKARKTFLRGLIVGAIAAGVTGGLAGKETGSDMGEKVLSSSADERAKLISELEKKKDFEILRDMVAEIECKKPGFVVGWIDIKTNDKKKNSIVIHNEKEYGILLDLMRKFKPEAVKVM